MTLKDSLGNGVTGASAAGLAQFETGLHQLQCYVGDPVASARAAIEHDPRFVMAHALHAYLHLLGTEPAGVPVARAAVEAVTGLPMTDRERGHVAAIRHLANGAWQAAARTLEDVAIAHPRDVLALQAGHLCDYFLGESRMLRDRIARARPAWSAGMPGYHAVLAMHAFGLEEAGDYAQAEALGRRAVALEPRDGWGQHAVAHVLEMQGRQRDGIAWMRADTEAWSKDNFFCIHNWWHLALYHLELGEIDAVLGLLDGPILGPRSTLVLDLIDASAMLWRLHLRGIDVGDRWNAVADAWAPHAADGSYAFNDMHAMMAFVGAGRRTEAEAVRRAQAEAMTRADDNARFTREVGQAATLAIEEFGRGRYETVVELLRPIRNGAARFGGSHAQRDILDLTLIEAALRAGLGPLAAALAAERIAVKPNSPLARLFVERATPTAFAA